MKKPYIGDLYWFPKFMLDMNKVKRYFTITLDEYNDNEEPIVLQVYKTKVEKKISWVGLPKGDSSVVKGCLKQQKNWKKLVDKQVTSPVKTKLKFLGELRPDQKKAIQKMSKESRGVLVAPARSGKTIMATQIAINKGMKTLILAHQTDLIEQFCNETINDKKEVLFNGATFKQPYAGICRKYEDFLKYDICLATYQSFIREGSGTKLLNKIKKLFGLVIIDEVHRTPADCYTNVLSSMWARDMIGLTATFDRKDGKIDVTKLLVGDMKHRAQVDTLIPKVYGRDSAQFGVLPRIQYKMWQPAMSFLFNNEYRNMNIAKTAFKDVMKGHIVLIPTVLTQHQQVLKGMINKLFGEDVCFVFNGSIPKHKRQQARDEMNKSKRIKVILAQRSMLTGMNIPRISAIYTIAPISNNPTYEQEVKRVCTPLEGKRTPIIRFWFDSAIPMCHGCLKTCTKLLTRSDFRPTKSFWAMTKINKVSTKQNIEDDGLSVVKTNHPKGRLRL